MAIYSYECTNCKTPYTLMRPMDERDSYVECGICGEELKRKIDRPGLVWAPTAGGMR